MVELKIDALKDLAGVNDCFVSVRVGDCQKLSRLAKSRTYRFPQAGERHFGKIEVFKRIGSCTVDIDPSKNFLREVSVDCGNFMGQMDFKVNVEADDASNRKRHSEEREAEKEAQKKSDNAKAKMAKEYLDMHGLEVHLSEAMQSLLRERPENPTEFLAMKLMSAPKTKMVKSPVKQSAPTSPAKSNSKADLLREKACGKILGISDADMGAALAKVGVAPNVAAARQQAETKLMGQHADLEKKISAVVSARAPATPAGKSVVAIIGNATLPPKPAAVKPMAAYHNAHILNIPKSSFVDIYNKFKSFKKAVEIAAPPAPKEPERTWMQSASVGTWLMPKREKSPAEIANAPAPKPYELPGAKAASISPAGQALQWTRSPSVGTWLAKPKVAKKGDEQTSYNFKPSVGTWLANTEEEDEMQRPASRKLLLRTADLYGASFPMTNMIRIL
eukprot:TRINITY_DN23853_c0_g1_i1.p2 TRINITY_DN23853_c0_g1~~TRINITY_DN23853_c0_g1_i1.p2  ORF type:complete len:447 (+),score=166.29 TRINITY_DN23853_c0_g1_i1:84-1424(+)